MQANFEKNGQEAGFQLSSKLRLFYGLLESALQKTLKICWKCCRLRKLYLLNCYSPPGNCSFSLRCNPPSYFFVSFCAKKSLFDRWKQRYIYLVEPSIRRQPNNYVWGLCHYSSTKYQNLNFHKSVAPMSSIQRQSC